MAVLLKVKNSQAFVDNLNNLLGSKKNGLQGEASWILEKFSNGTFYTYYTPNSLWNSKAWFRVCPDDVKRSFNESRGTSFNLLFRLHGTKSDRMSTEQYSYYHSRFVEFILDYLLADIKELSITTSLEDIEELDKFMNYDWR